MAQLPRIASSVPVHPATTPSRVAANGKVASHNSGIEESQISAAAQFDTAPFAFHEQTFNPANDDHRQPDHKRQHFGLLNAPSDAFATILEAGVEEAEIDDYGNAVQRVYSGTVDKAIGIYEQNHKVIHGTNPVRGTEVSLTL